MNTWLYIALLFVVGTTILSVIAYLIDPKYIIYAIMINVFACIQACITAWTYGKCR